MWVVIVIVAVAILFYIAYKAGKKDVQDTGELLIKTQNGYQSVNLYKNANIVVDLYLMVLINSLEENEDFNSNKEVFFIKKAYDPIKEELLFHTCYLMYKYHRVELTDNEINFLYTLVTYYANGYTNANLNRLQLLQSMYSDITGTNDSLPININIHNDYNWNIIYTKLKTRGARNEKTN